MLSHPGPDKNHVNLMHWLYRKSHSYIVKCCWFLQPLRQKIRGKRKERTAVAGSVFFKLEYELFKGKSVT